MKIAIVFDGLQIGGIERVGADYARILSELGHDVTVVNLVPNLKEMEKEFPKDCKWIGFNYPRRIVTEQYSAYFASDCFAVCRKFHEQSSVSEYCCGIPDWCGNRDDCSEFYERCKKIYGKSGR